MINPQAVVHHRLDLVLRLLDSVSGKEIKGQLAGFSIKSPGSMPLARDAANYLFMNTERLDFETEIYVHGYEPQNVKIVFPEGQTQPPIQEVYLLPLDDFGKRKVLTLRGNLPNIESVEAVSLTDVNCCIKEFDARKRIISVLNQRNVKFIHTHYGLINREKTAYEHFEIEKEISTQSIKCKNKLEQEFHINQPITRVVFGLVKDNGDYVLKVEDATIAQYLVKFVVDGKAVYQKVDFHNEGNLLVCNEEIQEKED